MKYYNDIHVQRFYKDIKKIYTAEKEWEIHVYENMICAKKLAKYYFENPLTLKDSFKFTIYDVQDKSIIWTNDFQNL